jgi:hypothetical protein
MLLAPWPWSSRFTMSAAAAATAADFDRVIHQNRSRVSVIHRNFQGSGERPGMHAADFFYFSSFCRTPAAAASPPPWWCHLYLQRRDLAPAPEKLWRRLLAPFYPVALYCQTAAGFDNAACRPVLSNNVARYSCIVKLRLYGRPVLSNYGRPVLSNWLWVASGSRAHVKNRRRRRRRASTSSGPRGGWL